MIANLFRERGPAGRRVGREARAAAGDHDLGVVLCDVV